MSRIKPYLPAPRVRQAREASELRPAERRLLRRYKRTGDPRARAELTERLLPLARSLAARYRHGREPFEDLAQVAALGLVKAIEGYEPDRGKPFTAYAVPTILGELRRHFRDRAWAVRLPRSLQERTADVREASERLTALRGREPSPAELAERLGIGVEEVLEAIRADAEHRTLSLDAPSAAVEEPEPLLAQVGATETGFEQVEAQHAAEAALLDRRELDVLRMRYGRDLTQAEIGARLGVSQMQISRIMRRALRKLLDALGGAGHATRPAA